MTFCTGTHQVPSAQNVRMRELTIYDSAPVNIPDILLSISVKMDGMELPGIRTWVVFYLISFVVLLWAAFLSSQGVMLWVSLLLVILIVGVNFVTVFNQIKSHAARREFQYSLTKDFQRGESRGDEPKKES